MALRRIVVAATFAACSVAGPADAGQIRVPVHATATVISQCVIDTDRYATPGRGLIVFSVPAVAGGRRLPLMLRCNAGSGEQAMLGAVISWLAVRYHTDARACFLDF